MALLRIAVGGGLGGLGAAAAELLSSSGPTISGALAGGARGVAYYALKRAPSAWEVLGPKTEGGERQPRVRERDATAAVSRRQQWQTLVLDCPRSLEAVMADQDSQQARIVTEASYPYRVVFANRAWEQLCGWSAKEALGKPGLGFMQGEATDPIAIKRLNAAVREGERVSVHVINYRKDGTPFANNVQVTPLRSRLGEYTHLLGILSEDTQCALPERRRGGD